ncbi:septum site-determining protein MinC [Prochlorococcus sp. AH-736-E15]|nr:septum site-determining protein MinC [Prochlorococcus sp. AH-736-E15]
MKLLISNSNEEYQETISLNELNDNEELSKLLSSVKRPFKVKIFAINESISAHQLSKFKNNLNKLKTFSLCIYSNNRDTVLAGKSLKINSNFVKEQEIKKKLLLLNSENKGNIFYKGTVRSGDRISSNGDLCIVGDVNPGAIVSAKKNIYVWGKLLGIAFAGKGGNHNASIASLYLNPLQLRIADVVAIGPKDKPKNYYPEIASIENEIITINPFIVETKN